MKHIPKPLLFITAGLGLVVIILVVVVTNSYFTTQGAKNENANAVTDLVNANQNSNANTNATINTNRTNTNTVNTNADVNANTNGARMAAGADQITWLAEPAALSDLELMANGYGGDHYYTVGTTQDGASIIYAYRDEMGYTVARFRENSDGSYVLLANYSDGVFASDAANMLSADVAIDGETVYTDLDAPDSLTTDGVTLERHTYFGGMGPLMSDVTGDLKTAEITDSGTLYVRTVPVATDTDNGSIITKQYILELADHSIVTYSVTTAFLGDDNSVGATWKSGYSNFQDRTFQPGIVAGGCGPAGNQYAVDMTDEALVAVGTTQDGETLFTVLDGDNTLLKNAYANYELGRDPATSTVLAYEDFVDAMPILIWKDAADEYLLFADTEFAAAVECGKPVVYLYPTTTTAVSVQVGADVRISEPNYASGWNVTAQPNGQLMLADGSVYPNLFWEGKGQGVYPAITSGRVVARSQVGTALRSDLIKQGLNAQEIKDFLEFWMPHMPNTPYVRLSWLSTEQMNQLAPLHIQPRPDTMIRVFLDFAGQTTAYTDLQPQTLTAILRDGFTVIEWGGLLLGQ